MRVDFEDALDAALPTIPAVESYVARVAAMTPADQAREFDRQVDQLLQDRIDTLGRLARWQVEDKQIADELSVVLRVCQSRGLPRLTCWHLARQIARLRERAGEA